VSLLLASATTYGIALCSRRNITIPIKRTTTLGIAGVMAVAVLLMFSGSTQEIAREYVLKGGKESATEAFADSRGRGASSQWQNFLKKPLTGNGFGVYADGHFPGGIVRLWGIPISASVEKGFLPTALPEETGLIGLAVFLWFFVTLVRKAISGRKGPWTALFFTCLYLNLGEYVFFSVGGIGLYYWCLIGLCIANGTTSAASTSDAPVAHIPIAPLGKKLHPVPLVE
jgi:hypothetical protein